MKIAKKLTGFVLVMALLLSGCAEQVGMSPQTDGEPSNTAQDVLPEILDNAEIPEPYIISVSAGENHTMALDDEGNVWAWGDNIFGQVGDGKFTTYLEPLYSDDYSEMEGTGYVIDTVRKDIDNDVYTPKIVMSGAAAIFARGDCSFVITADNELYAWGKNDRAQLGDGTTENKSEPTFIMGDVLHVDSTGYRTLIVKTDNTLWLLGRNFGFEWEDYFTEPVLLYDGVQKAVFDDSHAINAGGLLILRTDNLVLAYEPTDYNADAHVFFQAFQDAADISRASQQVYILSENGSVYGRGPNGNDGSLGAMGDEFWLFSFIPITSGVKKIMQGRFFIADDDSLLAWGNIPLSRDTRGERGDYGGGMTDMEYVVYGQTPTPIMQDIAMADGVRFHYIALDNDGAVYTWGQNSYGQLGTGDTENRSEPTRISFIIN
ncbi:MAG: hypothetical protein FWH20_11415 [Oscillospiraceae bacterium]|nr:hypothetical protein [Oscillospiraceae bacterium]